MTRSYFLCSSSWCCYMNRILTQVGIILSAIWCCVKLGEVDSLYVVHLNWFMVALWLHRTTRRQKVLPSQVRAVAGESKIKRFKNAHFVWKEITLEWLQVILFGFRRWKTELSNIWDDKESFIVFKYILTEERNIIELHDFRLKQSLTRNTWTALWQQVVLT